MIDNNTQALSLLGEQLVAMATSAAEGVLAYYQNKSSVSVEIKADGSPVTNADKDAHDFISKALRELDPSIPCVSEESSQLTAYEERKNWQQYWLVDPLDDTREFINRTGDFSVNIALIENGVPILGVVAIPVTAEIFLGIPGQGAWLYQGNEKTSIKVNELSHCSDEICLMLSKRRANDLSKRFLAEIHKNFTEVEIKKAGSSIKFCRVAQGSVDCFPCLGPTCEWDSAAAHAVVIAAGGEVLGEDLEPLKYNKESLYNPCFFVVGGGSFTWRSLMGKVFTHVKA